MKGIVEMLIKLKGKARQCEIKAVRIRKYMKLSPYQQLDPQELATKLGMQIISLNELPESANLIVKQLLLNNVNSWSGSSTGQLPDGSIFIVLNPAQSKGRRNATLMEEICHVLLGHKKSQLFYSLYEGRDYNQTIEDEAFSVGAAALLPFEALSFHLKSGTSEDQIARKFGVTKSLVRYRVTYTT